MEAWRFVLKWQESMGVHFYIVPQIAMGQIHGGTYLTGSTGMSRRFATAEGDFVRPSQKLPRLIFDSPRVGIRFRARRVWFYQLVEEGSSSLGLFSMISFRRRALIPFSIFQIIGGILTAR